MARLSSRELALERRKALTTSGKKSSVAAGDGANRVRTVLMPVPPAPTRPQLLSLPLHLPPPLL